MSNDLRRLESASALRIWEERRVRHFLAWKEAIDGLISGLRATLRRGSRQSRELDAFLRQRSAAEKAFVQALLAPGTVQDTPHLIFGGADLHPAPTTEAPPPPKKSTATGSDDPGTGWVTTASLTGAGSLLEAVLGFQRQVAKAREAFATSLLEGSVVSGVSATTTEFEKTGAALLEGLGAGIEEVIAAHVKVQEAMTAYHKRSIEPASSKSSSDPQSSSDTWLQEHRYRRAVMALQDKQRTYTSEVCSAILEARRLEEWRSEMSRKMLSRYCTKLFQVETAVQSLANDGVRALAGHQKEPTGSVGVLSDFEHLLKEAVPLPEEPPQSDAPEGTGDEQEWPALRRLWSLAHRGRPHASVLGHLCGPLEVARRWYGNQVSVVVLTKDFWLHCFQMTLEAKKKEKEARRGGSRSSPSTAAGVSVAAESGQDNLEAEPQWSIYVPFCSVTSPVSGKPLCFEIEEVRKGFLGMKNSRKEVLQAGSNDELARWTSALQQAIGKKFVEVDTGSVAATAAPVGATRAIVASGASSRPAAAAPATQTPKSSSAAAPGAQPPKPRPPPPPPPPVRDAKQEGGDGEEVAPAPSQESSSVPAAAAAPATAAEPAQPSQRPAPQPPEPTTLTEAPSPSRFLLSVEESVFS